ncbi:MAG: serine acetyltransferase [Bacteroidales bacterium]|nr:serine acetyltransferase [Bacteroidales bacterium]
MITDKESLKFYLAADWFALCKKRKRPRLFSEEIWKFEIALRKYEYYLNTHSKHSLFLLLARYRFHKLSVKLGFDIPPNVLGPGMKINHRGTIVINAHSHIGKWCDIHPGICIGDNPIRNISDEKVHQVPTVGDYVFLGPGAKLFGGIVVGSNVMIGANAVVNKNVESGMIVYGNPMNVRKSASDVMTTASEDFEMSFLKVYPQYKKFLL